MSNCNECVKINPLPECIEAEAYNPYYMDGLIFADTETNMIAKMKNEATKKIQYISFVTDADGEAILDIGDAFPLMGHVYTMEFVNEQTGDPEHFTITNTDGTTSQGCCIEFTVNEGQTDSNGSITVSTQDCQV